jgi:hypothetical protein
VLQYVNKLTRLLCRKYDMLLLDFFEDLNLFAFFFVCFHFEDY